MECVELSIIIPVYKTEERLLRNCIDSVLSGYRDKVETILVDDGTPDNGGVICDSYAEMYDNVIAVHQENQGVSVSRNYGVKLAQGKYIAFVDADDVLDLETYMKILTFMDSGLDICVFKYRRDANFVKCEEEPRMQTIDIPADRLLYAIANQNEPYDGYCFGSPWGKIFRKSFIDEGNLKFLPELRKMQDRVFMLYAIQAKPKMAMLPLEGYCYVKNDESIVNRYNPKIGEYLVRVANAIIEFNKKYYTFGKKEMSSIICKLLLEYIGIDTLHPDNPYSMNERRNELKKYCCQKIYVNAIKNPDYSIFSRNGILKLILLRVHCYKAILVINRMIN